MYVHFLFAVFYYIALSVQIMYVHFLFAVFYYMTYEGAIDLDR